MEQFGLLPNLNFTSQVLVTVFSDELINQSLKVASSLRQNKIKTDLYPDSSVKLDRQLKYADKKNIPYVLIIGPEEVKTNVVKLKNMKTGVQEEMKMEDVVNLLKK